MAPLSPCWRIPVLLVLALLSCQSGAGVRLDTVTDSRELAGRMVMLQPPEPLSWQSALSAFRSGAGSPLEGDYPGLGFLERETWFLLELENGTDQREWFLETATSFTDRVRLFLVDDRGRLQESFLSGDAVPYSRRPLEHPHIVFPLTLPTGENVSVLLQVETDNALDMPATLYSPEGFRHHEARRSLATGCYFGIVAIMCLYNLLIFLSIRDSSYLFYVGYLGLFGLTLLTRNGLAMQWLWPEQAWWNHHSQPLLTFLTLGFSVLFATSFLGIRQVRPRLYRGLVALAAATFAAAPLSLLIDFGLAIQLASAIFLPWTLGVIVLAAMRSMQGFVSAQYFLLAFAAVGVAVTLFGLRTFELIEGGPILEDLLPLTTAVEALLLSFALAHRMTALKRENELIQRRAHEELESRVEERTRELNEALNARSRFLATISHEVRTPLNGILGNIEPVREEGVSSTQARHLRIIEHSGETLLQLINDILDYSKIEAGKMTLEQQAFDLRQTIDHCLALFEQPARQNNTQLSLSLGDDISGHAWGDPLRIRQVLANLVSNAVKFTSDGRVEVRARREPENPDYVEFEVVDTGIGIEKEKLRELFEHFYQLDSSTSRRFGGTGLGLAICRQLVEVMGGEIGVDSEPGRGSRFWFRVPLPPSESAEPDPEETLPDTGCPAARLLVVDDNHINLMVAEGLCRKLGHTVITAQSGTEALALLINDPEGFDLILMDCEMPGMDGFETTGRIQKLQTEGRIGSVPVIALTAHAVPDKIRACREAGMTAHVAKPVNRDKLGRVIRDVLNGRSRATDDRQNPPAG